jgi:hypothetical protein
MREKKPRLVVAFSTATAAMELERYCLANGIPGRLIPTPRQITADCGLAWCADPASEQNLMHLMTDNDIVCQGVHKCMI